MAMKIITGYTGEKHITPIDDARLHMGLFGNGEYVLPTGSQLTATIETATEIRIADGELIMQGRYARNDAAYETVLIANGSQGKYRNDLIVARYTKDTSTSIESINLVVITGTASATSATDPEYYTGNIENGETRDFPLYRVRLNGVAIEAVEKLWVLPTMASISANTPEEALSFLGGTSIKKLWQNAKPTSSFAAQTISLDLSGYDFILLVYKGVNSSSHDEVDFAKVGSARYITYARYMATESHIMTQYLRSTSVTTSGVRFEECLVKDFDSKVPSDNNNNGIIPSAIYGIKGVQ